MIQLIPAIDIINGKCVRLTKGSYDTKVEYHVSPIDMACELEAKGFKRLHIVDLDGAKSRHIVNIKTLREITQRTHLKVDFGGGIKTDEDIKLAFENGASMVTIGSVAVTQRNLFLHWLEQYGADRIVLGADVNRGKISVNGWTEKTEEDIIPFLNFYIEHGVTQVLCTDISKDGTFSGPSVELYKKILAHYPQLQLIASGGISSVNDFYELEKLGVAAVVFGKAMFESKINIGTLLDEVKKGVK